MTRRSSGLSSLRNDDDQTNRPEPGQPAMQGIVQPMSFQLPPFDILHPLASLKQRILVKQHQTSLLKSLLDKDRDAYVNRIAQDERRDRHAHRIDRYRERVADLDDLAEALIEGQTRLTAFAQHHQRLTGFNTDSQIKLINELVEDQPTKDKLIESQRRQAANTFIELEALAMNNNVNPGNYGVAG